MFGNKRLRPCPFCGNTSVRLKRHDAKEIGYFVDRWSVLCDFDDGGCGAEGGWRLTKAEAEEAWNRREWMKADDAWNMLDWLRTDGSDTK